MFVQDLDEPAHVCPFKFLRKVDKKPHQGDRVLERLGGFIADLNGKPEPPDTHLVDAELPKIRLTLLVGQVFATCAGNDPAFLRGTRHVYFGQT